MSAAFFELLPSALVGGGVGAVVGVVISVLFLRRAGRDAAVEMTTATNERLNRIEHILTAPDQAWYWTDQWQRGEAEADADLAAGRGTVHQNEDDFLAALDRIPGADSPSTARH